MIKVQYIGKSFGPKRALHQVSFHIQRGEYVALLGVNGAGKTTLTRILATLSKATEGDVELAGYSLQKDAVQIRQRIGVMSHSSFLYEDLTAEENLQFYGNMYGVSELMPKVNALLTRVGLATRRYDRVGAFSRGMQQRLSLARALLHDPSILLLDEPFAGLDVNASDMVKSLLNELISTDKTVMLTTHDIDYALEHAQRILILKEGVLVANEFATALSHQDIRKYLAVE